MILSPKGGTWLYPSFTKRLATMGTHGRNGITRNGVHICYEQRSGGFNAAEDFLADIYELGTVPAYKGPTMADETDVCEHDWLFAHIDYDQRMIYTGYESPRTLLALTEDEVIFNYFGNSYTKVGIDQFRAKNKQRSASVRKLIKDGWTFYFDCVRCPPYSGCVNGFNYCYRCPECGRLRLATFRECIQQCICGIEFQTAMYTCDLCEDRIRCLSLPRAFKASWDEYLKENCTKEGR